MNAWSIIFDCPLLNHPQAQNNQGATTHTHARTFATDTTHSTYTTQHNTMLQSVAALLCVAVAASAETKAQVRFYGETL